MMYQFLFRSVLIVAGIFLPNIKTKNFICNFISIACVNQQSCYSFIHKSKLLFDKSLPKATLNSFQPEHETG